MRITTVYTRTGDAGQTRLAGGQQVWKDTVHVEAYGAVDELNAALGFVRALNEADLHRSGQAQQLEVDLLWVQNKFFDVGGILATAPGQTFQNMPTIKEQDVVALERMIDRCQQDLSPLQDFSLPGVEAKSPQHCIRRGQSVGAPSGLAFTWQRRKQLIPWSSSF